VLSPLTNDPKCSLCKLSQTTSRVCVLGTGPRRADVMIVGEAPGATEERTGEPFSGRAGALLTEILEEQGFDREDVFICNAVSCRPPQNRTPTKGEIKACKKWLDYQISMVKPKYVLLLGNVPLQSVTGQAGITKRRGKPWVKDGIIWLATYHPAFILRDPGQQTTLENDIKLFRDIVDFEGIPETKELSYRSVLTKQDVREMLRDLHGGVAFDIETTQLYPWRQMTPVLDKDTKKIIRWDPGPEAKIISMGFATQRTQWCLPVNHYQSPWSKAELEDIVDQISDRLEDCRLFTHNGKFDLLWMRVHFGVEWENEFDTMLGHFMLDENDRHGLKYLAQKIFNAPDWEIDKEEKQGQAPWSKHAKYLAHDIYYTRKLRYHFGKLLNEDPEVRLVFRKILMPCSNLFVEVEYNGVYVNQEKFDEAEEYLRGEYDGALKRLKKWEPPHVLDAKGRKKPFNWGSPQQLGALLFGDTEEGGLGLDPLDKTKGGGDSTSESVLKRLDHECVGDLLKFREAKQQLSFFIDGWKPYLVNGRLHPSFKLHGTVTGRLSCENPNLQQVPRDPRIRTLISAPEGWSLIEADLSQIELRIAAELANERAMIEAFQTGVDVHWLTALREISRGGGLKSLVISTAEALSKGTGLSYSKSIDILLKMGPGAAEGIAKEWKEYRKKAKAINFGYLYGMWWKKFKLYARDNYGVNVTDAEAQASREAFFELYSDLPEWHKRQRRYVRKHGYVKSLSGRKRRLPAARIDGDDHLIKMARQEAERQAINSPVQSFANEINLMAALQLRAEFPRRVLRIVGTVHDAILMEVRNDWVERVYKRTLEIMSRPALFDDFEIELEVPIEAEAKIGPWAGGVSLDKWLEKYNGKTKESA
jgi:uracil-DNA glycosylase family 4